MGNALRRHVVGVLVERPGRISKSLISRLWWCASKHLLGHGFALDYLVSNLVTCLILVVSFPAKQERGGRWRQGRLETLGNEEDWQR